MKSSITAQEKANLAFLGMLAIFVATSPLWRVGDGYTVKKLLTQLSMASWKA